MGMLADGGAPPTTTAPATRPRRRWKLRVALAVLVVALVAGGFAIWWYEPFRPGLADCADGSVPTGTVAEAQLPWQRFCSGIEPVLTGIGVPQVDPYVEAMHVHVHLAIKIRRDLPGVPAGVGLNAGGQAISPLHTHTPDGLVHVESPTVRPYRLGEFFAVWGVRLTDQCVGAYCASDRERLVVYVDGKPVLDNPANLELRNKLEITILFGSPDEVAATFVKPVDWSTWDV